MKIEREGSGGGTSSSLVLVRPADQPTEKTAEKWKASELLPHQLEQRFAMLVCAGDIAQLAVQIGEGRVGRELHQGLVECLVPFERFAPVIALLCELPLLGPHTPKIAVD